MARSNTLQRSMDFWIGVPTVRLVGFFRRRRSLPSAPGRIGVISPTAIGDLILDSGVLLHLRTLFPQADIHLFHGASNAGAVTLLPIDLTAHKCDFTRVGGTIEALQRARLDVLADLTPWPRLTALCAAFSGAATVGFHSFRQMRHYAFDRAVEHRPDRHEVDNLRSLAEVFGPCPDYQVRLRQDLPSPSLPLPYERLVLCHMCPGGARAREKSWPQASWIQLAGRLVAAGYSVGFTGTGSDRPVVDAVLSAAALPADRAFSLCGRLSIAELASVLKAVRLLITVDTGILHLASALNVATVALHGPTRSWRWGGRSPAVISLDAPHPQAGFVHLGFEASPDGGDIMSGLGVDAVYAAGAALLRSGGVRS